ncbi:MAG: crossover junction endodeoxyribonuclease RuvC [Verrucomicrobiota bacterium]
MRLLSIDPALRNTGYAIIEQVKPREYRALAYGVVKNPARLLQTQCLVEIRKNLVQVVERFSPECCAVESVIYVQSYKTAIIMGAARAAALLPAAEAGMPVFEYSPRRVKQVIVGRGGAEKQQVAFMVRSLLHLEETPPPDAADALAIGLAHFHFLEKKELGLESAVQV